MRAVQKPQDLIVGNLKKIVFYGPSALIRGKTSRCCRNAGNANANELVRVGLG